MIRIVWLTERRITNLIWELGLILISKKKSWPKYPRSATWRQSVMKWNSAVCWNPSLLNLIVFDIVLPAILGVHGMLTQTQSHFAEKMEAGKALRGSGLKKYKPGELNTAVLLYVLRVVLLQSMGAIYNLCFCLWETYKTLFLWKGLTLKLPWATKADFIFITSSKLLTKTIKHLLVDLVLRPVLITGSRLTACSC